MKGILSFILTGLIIYWKINETVTIDTIIILGTIAMIMAVLQLEELVTGK